MPETEIIEEALKLPVEDRLALAERLWQSVEDVGEAAVSPPLHDWQKTLLDQRQEEPQQNPEGGLTWEEVKTGVLSSLAKRRKGLKDTECEP